MIMRQMNDENHNSCAKFCQALVHKAPALAGRGWLIFGLGVACRGKLEWALWSAFISPRNANAGRSPKFEHVFYHSEPRTLRLNMLVRFEHVFHAEPRTLRLNML
jgi:hypothetical protein